jgi:hypothetical protein
MDSDHISEIPTGQELNTLVATEIMGNKVVHDEIFGLVEIQIGDKEASVVNRLRPYSEDTSAARLVVARMIDLSFDKEVAYWESEDRPDVICRAALRAVLQRKKDEEAKLRRSRFAVIK